PAFGTVLEPTSRSSPPESAHRPARRLALDLARHVEVLGAAPDARVGPVVVGAREKVALASHPEGLAEVADLDAVQEHAIPRRVAVPDLHETAVPAALDLDLHAPGAVGKRGGGRDVPLHREGATAVVGRVVVPLLARHSGLVPVAALEVE